MISYDDTHNSGKWMMMDEPLLSTPVKNQLQEGDMCNA